MLYARYFAAEKARHAVFQIEILNVFLIPLGRVFGKHAPQHNAHQHQRRHPCYIVGRSKPEKAQYCGYYNKRQRGEIEEAGKLIRAVSPRHEAHKPFLHR